MSVNRNCGKYPGLLLYIDDLFFMASISGKAFKEVVLALAAYASDGEIPVHLKGQTLCIFNMLAVKVDANAARYDAVVERKAAQSGCRAGRPGRPRRAAPAAGPAEIEETAEENRPENTENGEGTAAPSVLPAPVPAAPETRIARTEAEKPLPSARFTPPTEEEVSDYIAREGLTGCDNFYHFYAARGWMMGKTPMADWHSAIRSFEDYHKQNLMKAQAPPPKIRPNGFGDYEQRTYPAGCMIGGEIDLLAEARALFGEDMNQDAAPGKEAPS